MNAGEITLTQTGQASAAEVHTGTRLSFEQIFTAHSGLVYRYACALTRDGALAEDVTQEVFLRLHGQLDSAQRDGMLRPWLLRVTANVARNLLRTRRRAALRDDAFAAAMVQSWNSEAPDDALARQAEIEDAKHALSLLKEPLRTCLLLRHEGLSYREIAATLSLKETSVGSLIVRASQKFMKLYLKTRKAR